MTTLLLPIAGRSSRFPNMRPKWSLTHPRGDMMVIEAIKGLDASRLSDICVIGLREHDQKFQLVSALSAQFESLNLPCKARFVLLDEPTRNQPETVAQGIVKGGVSGPVYIKDSDNFFRDAPGGGNCVAGYDLHLLDKVNARSKSYFEVNGDGYLTNIVEKRITSSRFCVGGYSFADAGEYLRYFERHGDNPDLYISHIIYGMILDGVPFTYTTVSDYVDWGTLREWRAYTMLYSTLFIDLDGTLVRNSAERSEPFWGTTDGIQPNIDTVNHLYDSGKVEVIVTTSRKESYRAVTEAQLERVGLKYHRVIYGLPHGKRIVINDYAPSNPFKSCDAINIKRNSADLKEMLEDSIGFDLNLPLRPDA
jgi:hypothetical protein